MGAGLTAELALAPSVAASGATLPTGSAIFAADPATKVRLAAIGRANDVWFQRVGTSTRRPSRSTACRGSSCSPAR